MRLRLILAALMTMLACKSDSALKFTPVTKKVLLRKGERALEVVLRFDVPVGWELTTYGDESFVTYQSVPKEGEPSLVMSLEPRLCTGGCAVPSGPQRQENGLVIVEKFVEKHALILLCEVPDAEPLVQACVDSSVVGVRSIADVVPAARWAAEEANLAKCPGETRADVTELGGKQRTLAINGVATGRAATDYSRDADAPHTFGVALRTSAATDPFGLDVVATGEGAVVISIEGPTIALSGEQVDPSPVGHVLLGGDSYHFDNDVRPRLTLVARTKTRACGTFSFGDARVKVSGSFDVKI